MKKIKDIIYCLIGALIIISILGIFAGALVIIWYDSTLGGKMFLTNCITLLLFGFLFSLIHNE